MLTFFRILEKGMATYSVFLPGESHGRSQAGVKYGLATKPPPSPL